MKIKKVHIKNFESIEDIELEFKKSGVYIITGLNNIGKSALLSGLEVLFYNVVPAKYKDIYIRDFCSDLEVYCEDYDGNKFSISRGDSNFYSLTPPDGEREDFYKLERSVPSKISNIINFYTDPISKQKMNYRGNDADLILVTTTPGETYNILQFAIKTTEVNSAIKTGNQIIRETSNDMETAIDRIKTLEYQLSGIKTYDLSNIEKAVDEMVRLDTAVENLEVYSDRITGVETLKASLAEAEYIVFASNKALQLYADIKLLNQYISLLQEIKNVSDSIAESSEQLSTLQSNTDSIERFIVVSRVANLYSQEKLLSDKFGETMCILARLSYIIEKLSAQKLLVSYTSMQKQLSETITKIDSISLPVTDNLSKMVSTIKLCNHIVSTMNVYRSNTVNINNVTADINSIENKKLALFKEHGYCPTCKRHFETA